MQEKYCQSCAMPMGQTNELYGTNVDGQKNDDYCHYCYRNGAFTIANCTMSEMIEVCLPHMLAANKLMNEAQARTIMQTYFPTLKRWQKS